MSSSEPAGCQVDQQAAQQVVDGSPVARCRPGQAGQADVEVFAPPLDQPVREGYDGGPRGTVIVISAGRAGQTPIGGPTSRST